MLNLYLVISETLYEKIPITDDGDGPLEPYSICELILAPTRGKAKWLAWREDESFNGDIVDMPKFRTKVLAHYPFLYTGEENRIVSDNPLYQNFWQCATAIDFLNKCNRENF